MKNNDDMSKDAKDFYDKRKKVTLEENRIIESAPRPAKYATTMELNFFIIRETYLCVAKQRKIKNAMNRFYDHLGITADSYNQIIYKGVRPKKAVIDKLVNCGFADTLFRKQNPTSIKLGGVIEDLTWYYLSNKSIKLSDYRKQLMLQLVYVRDPDDTYLVITVDRLIRRIIKEADPDDTYDEFLEYLVSENFDFLHLQKYFPESLLNFYKQYKKLISNDLN